MGCLGGVLLKKLLIAYYSKTGNTKKVAEKISKGAKNTTDVEVELAEVGNIDAKQACEADGFAFGSPSYFSIMSGPLLTLLTELYYLKNKIANKPMAAFATGSGSQAKTVENIESILKAYNPQLISGIAVDQEFTSTDSINAQKLGEKLATAVQKA